MMDWQRIAHTDPYLAGSIAFRESYIADTAEENAASVGLVGDRLADFLRGWNDEKRESEEEKKILQEYDEMAAGWEKGDPAR